MKAVAKYISRHLIQFIALILVLVVLNVLFFGLTFRHIVIKDYGDSSPRMMLEKLSKYGTVDSSISKSDQQSLRANDIWAMFLREDGSQAWSFDTPSNIPQSYAVQDVAVFSRGYLCDYPVFVQSMPDGLLVLGYPKNSYAKLVSNYYSIEAIRLLPCYFLGILAFDLLFLFLAYHASKYRIIKSTEPIVSAVNSLANGKAPKISVCGELAEISDSVSKAGQVISRQNEARANWINGVSHDIRTPLSLIMGYAERISSDYAASDTIKSEANIVRRQSVVIKDLIQDLNLVSKLEYEMQPLQKEQVRLSKLLRTYVAELLNGGVPEQYVVELSIAPNTESLVIECDARLITRAINNLVQNSIQHNPAGCSIVITLSCSKDGIQLSVEDDGVGISESKQRELQTTPHYMESTDEQLNLRHGLGLLLVKEITVAHGGTMKIYSQPNKGCKIELTLSTL